MASEADNTKLVSSTDAKATAFEVAAFVTSAIPYIGGPIANILSGVATTRKLNRIREVLESCSNL